MLGTLTKFVLSAVLFYVFTPGVFFTVPAGNQMAVTAVHAVLFAVSNVIIWKVIKLAKK
jgi:hypothetical protein